MKEDIPEKGLDITGVELTPGKADVCPGNGEQGYECCCDECDYCLLCFPIFDLKELDEKLAKYKKKRNGEL